MSLYIDNSLKRHWICFSISKKGAFMKVLVIVKATKESEAGAMPNTKMLTEMGQFNEKLVNAGIMVSGEGLHASSKGKRVRFIGNERTVIDGPFGNTNELIAGFWICKVASMDEAVQWVKRCPNPMSGESEIEIRPILEAGDFGPALTPELKANEERLRKRSTRTGFITSGVGPSLSEMTYAAKRDAAILLRNIAKQRDNGRRHRSRAKPEWSYETSSKE
jgi:hypothetical protein